MPGRDGTGPMGLGPKTGRALGLCTGSNMVRCGFGRGINRGYCRNFVSSVSDSNLEKELLSEQKVLLESRLNSIEKTRKSIINK